MKLCLLFLVAAVCCMLPPDGEAAASHLALLKTVAKRSASILTRDVHSLLNKKALRHARHLQRNKQVQREVLDFSDMFSGEDELQEYRKYAADYLHSDEAAVQMKNLGISLDVLNEIIDSDDEISAEDKDLFKVIVLLMMSGELGSFENISNSSE